MSMRRQNLTEFRKNGFHKSICYSSQIILMLTTKVSNNDLNDELYDQKIP